MEVNIENTGNKTLVVLNGRLDTTTADKFMQDITPLMQGDNPDDLTKKLYHINNEAMIRFWKLFAYEYFGADTPEKLAEVENKLRPFAALKILHFGIKGYDDFIRESLLG